MTLWCMFDIGGMETGLMDLTMNWMKNKTLVNDTDHTTWDVDTTPDNNQMFYLNITNIKPSDYGEYECVGSNSVGNDTKVLALLPPQPHSGQSYKIYFEKHKLLFFSSPELKALW